MTDYDILNTITSEFANSFSECTVEYPNDVVDSSNISEWVRISVKAYPPRSLNLAKTSAMRFGCLYIQVFVKPKTGAGRGMTIASAAAAVFESKIISGVEFDFSSISDVGLGLAKSSTSQDSGWYQILVSIDYKAIS